jgi:hypothetical protein
MLQATRSRVLIPLKAMDFCDLPNLSSRPEVDSASKINEYQGSSVKISSGERISLTSAPSELGIQSMR